MWVAVVSVIIHSKLRKQKRVCLVCRGEQAEIHIRILLIYNLIDKFIMFMFRYGIDIQVHNIYLFY